MLRRQSKRTGRSCTGLAAFVWSLAAVFAVVPPAGAQTAVTQEEALRLAFPEPATINRRTAFLEDSDIEAARALAGPGVEVAGRVVTYYVASRADTPLGVAYFDAHRVRTLPEVLMIVVTPDDRIRRIEILKFAEPPEYKAPPSWLEQFANAGLSEDLSLKGSIVNMTGATLTSRAVTGAARRALALHRVIRPFEK